MYSPVVSVYFTIPYANKEYVKCKYGAKWSPSNKEWIIKLDNQWDEGWYKVHQKIIELRYYLHSIGHKINLIEGDIRYLDDFGTYKILFGNERPKEEIDDFNISQIAISNLIDTPIESFKHCVIEDENDFIKPVIKSCMDCKCPITWGTYIRCFNCNRDYFIKKSNETNECFIIDE